MCFQFYYHMYGPHIGTLNVFVKSGTSGSKIVWNKSLNQGNKWVFAEVTIPQSYTNYQVSSPLPSYMNYLVNYLNSTDCLVLCTSKSY